MSAFYIKIVKVSLLSLFVSCCALVVVFALFLHLSPIYFSSSCSLSCDYRNRTTLQQFQNSKGPTDYENICLPCLFSTPAALFLSFLTLLLCFLFVFATMRTAFGDPGYLSLENQNQENRDNNTNDNDNVEMTNQNQQRTAVQSGDENQKLKLQFQWRTSSGKSRVMTWDEGSDRMNEDINGETNAVDLQQSNENDSNHTAMAIDVKPRVKFCRTCEIFRPPRASHSRKSQRCVKNFDHFCAVTHSDIGSGNIATFRLLVFSITCLALVVLVTSSYSYHYLVTRIPPSIESNNKDYANGEVIALTMIIICAFAVLPLIAFSLFYLRLWICLGGMTWREYVKRGTVFISHDFATQFDDPCSNCVRSFHCGRGGNLGEVASCCCGFCFLFGYGADGEGPTCLSNRCWRWMNSKSWLSLSHGQEDEGDNRDERYDPENPANSEKYLIIPRPV